jgi:hypothetical protein
VRRWKVIIGKERVREASLEWSYLEPTQAGAGFVQVVVFLGEAKPQQIFAVAGTEEGGACDGGYAGGGEEVAGLFRGALAGEAGDIGQDIVSPGGDSGFEADGGEGR